MAYDPAKNPTPTDVSSWRMLQPINLAEQITLPNDAAAMRILHECATGIVGGQLWAEPPLSGQVEPWRSYLRRQALRLARAN
jgi:hypothetical protein